MTQLQKAINLLTEASKLKYKDEIKGKVLEALSALRNTDGIPFSVKKGIVIKVTHQKEGEEMSHSIDIADINTMEAIGILRFYEKFLWMKLVEQTKTVEENTTKVKID